MEELTKPEELKNVKIKYTQEQIDFIKSSSVNVTDGTNTWYHIRYWFKEHKDDGVFELIQFEELPKDIGLY